MVSVSNSSPAMSRYVFPRRSFSNLQFEEVHAALGLEAPLEPIDASKYLFAAREVDFIKCASFRSRSSNSGEIFLPLIMCYLTCIHSNMLF